MKYPSVSIIILNWNGWEDTLECLDSLYDINYSNYEVIIVDNGSEDNSINKIKNYCTKNDLNLIDINYFQENFHFQSGFKKFNETIIDMYLIKNDKNYGFAEGNNIGIRFILQNINSDYVLLLNNDTVVDQEFLSLLVDATENNKNIGITGPTVIFYDNNRIQSSGAMINWKKGISISLRENESPDFLDDKIITVDYVSGCAFLVKSKIFTEVGLLDPQYFLYWEEADFCVRAQKKGYSIINVPKSKVWHKVSSSTGNKGIYHYYMKRNMFWFIKCHATIKQRISFILYFLFFRIWIESFILIFYYRDIDSLINLIKGTLNGLFEYK